MQGMITGKWITGQQDLTDALEIRQKVFVQEQGFPAESGMRSTPRPCTH